MTLSGQWKFPSQQLQVCSNVLSSALNPQASQAGQKMQVFRGNQQQPRQSRSAACSVIPNQQNFTKQDERFKFSTIFSGCQIGQVHVTFRSNQAQWHSSWSSLLRESKIFEHFVCFYRTLGISPEDLGEFKADIPFIYSALACLLTISTFDFCNAKFDWFFIIRCAFWLVSRKNDCLEHVLRKPFWIKKLINTISIHLSN